MYLVLCSSSDASALWAFHGLRGQSNLPVELVLTESLAGARWEHRLSGGDTHLKISFADGHTVCSSRIRGVLNRLLFPSSGNAPWATDAEREYAQGELYAFYMSWLQGLPGVVINRPSTTSFTGAYYRVSEWVYRAHRVGLKTAAYRLTGTDDLVSTSVIPVPAGAARQTLVVLGGKVFGGHVPDETASACVRLASEAKTELLGVDLYADADGEWTFAGATSCPDLSVGGTALLDQFAYMFSQGEKP